MPSQAPTPPLRRRTLLLAAATAAIPAAVIAAPAATPVRATALPDFGPAPEFVGIAQWFNTGPLSISRLRGRVVLVEFWTYGCVNCVRSLPHVNRWAARYAADGLTVVGVHTPEFPFERSTPGLEAAMRRLGVKHPVAQDNRYATWKAYANQYWPATYLVDAQGRIRFKHFGEGEYERTEGVIQALLAARP